MTTDGLTDVVQRYEDAIRRATAERDAAIRSAAKQGKRQVDIVKETGYSRETIRRIVDPSVRETIRSRRQTAAS
jgi:hypothetical protein